VKLLLATRNRNKVIEMRHLLEGTGWEVVALSDIEGAPDVVEDQPTFEGNAGNKARAAAGLGHAWILAEDAGLEVDALGGEPGVMSARYCGEGATDAERIRKVLSGIIAVPDQERTARFRCVMCLIDPDGQEKFFEGSVEGRIAHTARGTAGFGYDPVFMPEGHGKTFAELGLEVKNRISHRSRALRQVIEYLKSRAE